MLNKPQQLEYFENRAMLFGQLDGNEDDAGTITNTDKKVDAGNNGTDARLFTQEQVDKIVGDRVKNTSRELTKLTDERDTAATQLNDMQELIRQAAEEEGIDVDNLEEDVDEEDVDEESLTHKFRNISPEAAKALTIVEKRSKREINKLTTRIGELENINQEQADEVYSNEKRTVITNALRNAGAEEELLGQSYFNSHVFLDEVDGKWYVKDPKDQNKPEMLLEEGIKEYLPLSLKKSVINSDGGGSRSSRGKGSSMNDLAQAEQDLTTIKELQSKNPHDHSLTTRYLQQLRKAKVLRKEITS